MKGRRFQHFRTWGMGIGHGNGSKSYATHLYIYIYIYIYIIYICIYMFRIWKCVKYIVGLLAIFFWASWPAQLGLATNGMGTHVWTIFWLGNDDNLLESLDFRLMEFAFHLDCSKCWLGMCAEGEEWGQRRWERTDTIRYDWIFFIWKV